ncbi:hypothetical protein F5884DRAFT_154163 [Xylogone sp. PMI_703]|nr:hypothetical protein F5884DRAFT_154163 [Xylogone sp. PMI_703]
MAPQQSTTSSSLPRGFRFHHWEGARPITPEPLISNDVSQPSPPRPPRLKIRRRNVSSLHAPTEQFLASVAVADTPIPTIEIPQLSSSELGEDLEMQDGERLATDSGLLAPERSDIRAFSPPRTPLPKLIIGEARSERPDWSKGATSLNDDDLERPTSSHSIYSDFSDDSSYSGSRISQYSDDGSCTSPESDIAEPFRFPSFTKRQGRLFYSTLLAENKEPITPLNFNVRSKTRNDAPWTRAMSAHLWSVYILYLQDPTVTPFRVGASGIPPEGVCHRVAREAKRSWKGGPKAAVTKGKQPIHVGGSPQSDSDKSGSITPTGEPIPKVYVQWPHSSAATRAHLRELCKNKGSVAFQRQQHLQSRSPTPFTKSFPRTRLRTPESRVSSFSTNEISFSLSTSTAETMRPDGPLAKLTASDEPSSFPTLASMTPAAEPSSSTVGALADSGLRVEEVSKIPRLRSPFVARTYGPSSSRPATRPSLSQSNSDISSLLTSPIQIIGSRSLNSTQKRRAQHSLDEELSPSGAVLRPSILDEQLFGESFPSHQRRVRRSRGFSLGDEVFCISDPRLFQPPPVEAEQRSIQEPAFSDPFVSSAPAVPRLLPSATFEPPRLRSPFAESGPRNTFPRRLFQDNTATVRRSAFATMHPTRRSIDSFDFTQGPTLDSRLSQIDQRLAEIRDRSFSSQKYNQG